MSEFENILNAEIVDSGRVPDAKVISRALRIGEMLENHYSDLATLTPVVSSLEDLITWQGDLDEDSGFRLQVRLRHDDQIVEEELIVWHKPEDIYITVRGLLAVKDFEYALTRDKEYVYLDEPITD